MNEVRCGVRLVTNASSDRSGENSRLQLGMHDLEESLRLAQIFQPVLTKIYDLDHRVANQLLRRE